MKVKIGVAKTPSKFLLYETAVQTPDAHAETFSLMHAELRGSTAHVLREDFCGTFAISCEWAKLSEKNSAYGLDLDAATLSYGKNVHLKKLSPKQRKRVHPVLANVLTFSKVKADVIAACNFSFWIFKQRALLKKYFVNAHRSLNKKGIFILETAGGPGMIEKVKESKSFKLKDGRRYSYTWDQQSFDPITHDGKYAIHFKMKNGLKIENAFTYDWRVWTIPELKDLLVEAGFKQTQVYWETSKNGKGTGQYLRHENGDNAYSWVAYVVGLK